MVVVWQEEFYLFQNANSIQEGGQLAQDLNE